MLVQIKQNPQLGTAVSGRDLHQFLESKQDFTTWVKGRIAKYGFIEGEDYLLHKFMVKLDSGSKEVHDYVFTLDVAKELAMLEGNDKGRQIRRYFIQVEKEAKQVALDKLSPLEILKAQIQLMEAQEQRLVKVEEKISQVITSPTGFFTVAGYASNKGLNMTLSECSTHGRAITKIVKDMGMTVETMPDPRFGRVNVYPVSILERYFSENNLDNTKN